MNYNSSRAAGGAPSTTASIEITRDQERKMHNILDEQISQLNIVRPYPISSSRTHQPNMASPESKAPKDSVRLTVNEMDSSKKEPLS